MKRARQSLDSRFVPSGWRAVAGVVAAVLLVVGVALLIARAAGFARVWDEIREANAAWFAVCLAAQLVALAAYTDVVRGAFRWRGGPDPGFGLSARVVLAGIGATRVFAAAGVGAIAVAFWCFRRAGFSNEGAVVRVLGLNVLFYVPFGIGIWCAALAVASGAARGEAPSALTVPWLVLVPACLAGALFATQPGRVDRLTKRRGSFVRRALGYVVAALGWVRDVLSDTAGRRLVGSTVVYWVANVSCLWAALRSVDESVSLPELLLAFAAGHAAMLLPLPLGGAGGVDAAMTYGLTAVGVPLAPALVAVGVYRLFAFWAPTIPGIASLVVLPRTGRRLSGRATT